MPVSTSISVPFNGGGIGTIAYHACKGLQDAGLLERVAVPSDHSNLGPVVQEVAAGNIIERAHYPFAAAGYGDYGFHVKDDVFDRVASHYILEGGTFYGWPGMFLRTVRRNEPERIVINGSSTHVLDQQRLVEKEYAKHGVKKRFSCAAHVRKILHEYERTDRVIAASDFVKQSFLRHGFDEMQVDVVPFGVDLDRFRPREMGSERFTVVFVGHLNYRKGVPYVLEAWKQADIDGRLVLAGPIKPEIKPLLRRYRDVIEFETPGYVDDIQQLYADADVFLFPSIEEGSALVTYEAMASGLPIITTPNSGSVARDGTDGFIIEPGSADAVAEKLAYLYEDREAREKFGKHARGRAEEYPWTRYEEQVASLFGRR